MTPSPCQAKHSKTFLSMKNFFLMSNLFGLSKAHPSSNFGESVGVWDPVRPGWQHDVPCLAMTDRIGGYLMPQRAVPLSGPWQRIHAGTEAVSCCVRIWYVMIAAGTVSDTVWHSSITEVVSSHQQRTWKLPRGVPCPKEQVPSLALARGRVAAAGWCECSVTPRTPVCVGAQGSPARADTAVPMDSLPQPAGKAANGLTSGRISLEHSLAAPVQSAEEDRRVEWKEDTLKWNQSPASVPVSYLPALAISFIHISAGQKRIWQWTLGIKLLWVPSSQAFTVTSLLRSQLKRPWCLQHCQQYCRHVNPECCFSFFLQVLLKCMQQSSCWRPVSDTVSLLRCTEAVAAGTALG